MRCGSGYHRSGNCGVYGYYNGKGCSKCSYQHETRDCKAFAEKRPPDHRYRDQVDYVYLNEVQPVDSQQSVKADNLFERNSKTL